MSVKIHHSRFGTSAAPFLAAILSAALVMGQEDSQDDPQPTRLPAVSTEEDNDELLSGPSPETAPEAGPVRIPAPASEPLPPPSQPPAQKMPEPVAPQQTPYEMAVDQP